MHTALYRANALLTYAGTALAILAALASLTGVLVPFPAPAPLTATLNARRLVAQRGASGGRAAGQGGATARAREQQGRS